MDFCENLLEEFHDAIAFLDDIPAALSFCESLSEKYESLAEWLADNGAFTDAQIEAIENMIAAANRWRRD